jgi:hypothetical protein
MARLHVFAGERKGAIRGGAHNHFPGGDGVSLPGYFELHHAVGFRDMARFGNLPGGS